MFIFLILIFVSSFNKSFSSYIILPFKSENSNFDFIQSKYDIGLYTYMELGEPRQKIKVYFRDDFFSFFIMNKDTTYNDEEIKEKNTINIPDVKKKVKIDNLYNNKISSTYENISDYKKFFIDIYYRKGFLSSEKFYFNTKIENTEEKSDKIEFVLVNKIKPNRTLISGAIGLLVDEYFLEGAQSFPRMLVKNNVTSFCIWSKIYNDDKSGIFIFGDFPHVLLKDKFYKEQYVETNIKLNIYIQKWNIDFNEIFMYITNNNFNNDNNGMNSNDTYNYFYLNKTLYGELKHNLGLIIGTLEYQNLIEDIFFNAYIKDGICYKNKILINDFNDMEKNFTYYNCNRDKSFNKESFPKLFFKQNDLKYIFELNDKDLFIPYDNRWYFLIIFEGEETADYIHKWMFGEPLLKKYSFVFDPINYKIGFYNPLIPIMKKEKSIKSNETNNVYNYKKIIYFAIIILFTIFLILLLKFVKNSQKNKIDNHPYTELQNITIQKE